MLRSTHFKSSEMIDSTLIPNCEAAASKHMFLNKEMACLGPFSHMHHSFEVDSTQSFMWKCSKPEKVFALLGSKDKAQKMTLGSTVPFTETRQCFYYPHCNSCLIWQRTIGDKVTTQFSQQCILEKSFSELQWALKSLIIGAR